MPPWPPRSPPSLSGASVSCPPPGCRDCCCPHSCGLLHDQRAPEPGGLKRHRVVISGGCGSGTWACPHRILYFRLSRGYKHGIGSGLWSHVKARRRKGPLPSSLTWLLAGSSSARVPAPNGRLGSSLAVGQRLPRLLATRPSPSEQECKKSPRETVNAGGAEVTALRRPNVVADMPSSLLPKAAG